jgi:hypothetical protein
MLAIATKRWPVNHRCALEVSSGRGGHAEARHRGVARPQNALTITSIGTATMAPAAPHIQPQKASHRKIAIGLIARLRPST